MTTGTAVLDRLAAALDRLEPASQADGLRVLEGLAHAMDANPDSLRGLAVVLARDLPAITGSVTAEARRAVAFHEAGHALAAHAAGLPVLEVSVIPRAVDATPSLGHVLYDWAALDGRDRLYEQVLARATLTMAGPIAERLADHEPTRHCYNTHHAEALLLAQRLGLFGGMDEALAVVTLAERRATGLLLARWPAVEAVAAGLEEFGTLPGDVVADTIRQALAAMLPTPEPEPCEVLS